MLMEIRKRCHRDEGGSALVIALVMISVLAVGSAALLSFAEVSIRTTVAVQSQGAKAYAADGAVQAAINYVRSRSTLGLDPQFTGNVNQCSVPAVGVNSITPTVTCLGQTNSGKPGAGSAILNAPKYGLLTLSTAAPSTEDGFQLSQNNTFRVSGSVYSDSSINVTNSNASVSVTGTVTAGSCGANPSGIVATDGVACNSTTIISDPGLSDVSYNPIMLSPPVTVSVLPACNANVAIFTPGTYADASGLTSLAQSCKTLIFAPNAVTSTSVYYFNFPDGSPQWTVNPSATIIGGAATTGNAGCDATKSGVQFVFGGQSQVVFQGGSTFNICPVISSGQQEIAVYGMRSPLPSGVSGYRSQSGCAVTPGDTGKGGSACALIFSKSQMSMVVSGTVYAPQGAMNVNVTNAGSQIFGRGAIVRSLYVSLSGSVNATVPSIQVPFQLASFAAGNRTVQFTAAVSGKNVLQAVATFDDNSDTKLAGKFVTVTAWSVQR
jgi:hypothetical protein